MRMGLFTNCITNNYGFHLHDGPWYTCRDVTCLPSTGDNQSDLNYDYAYDWFEHKNRYKGFAIKLVNLNGRSKS